jgi:CDP-4-dehydro-6-deoxyglucose reductase, E3
MSSVKRHNRALIFDEETASTMLTVTVQPSGRTFEVAPDETILKAAIRQGVGLPYGCRDGACGSCKSRLVQGEVDLGSNYQEKALNPKERADGWILTCQAHAQTHVVLEARGVVGADEFPVRKMPGRVMKIERPAPDVAVIQLQLPSNDPLRYRAGQYIDFILKDGSRRSYSMANAPHRLAENGCIELHLRHMPGGVFTDHVFGVMKERDLLRLEGPFGSFYLRDGGATETDAPIILLASGTGFAPVKAILEHLQLKNSTRPMVLYWGARSRVDLYLHDWAVQMQAQMPHLKYIPVLSEARSEDNWQGRSGWVHQAVMDDFADLSNHQVYACGAPVMVDAARAEFVAQRGLSEDAFFADAFYPAGVSKSN